MAGAAPEQDGEEAAAAQQAAAPKEKTKITAQKFNYMRVSSRTQLSGMGTEGGHPPLQPLVALNTLCAYLGPSLRRNHLDADMS